MRTHHYALLFLIFLLAVVIRNDITVGRLKAVSHEKEDITERLDSAATDAVSYLAKKGVYGTNEIKKDEVISTYLTSLYSSFGIISDIAAQRELEMYIPVILICDSDGYYVYYYDDYKAADNNFYAERVWSEKMPYFYKDDDFIYRFSLSDTITIFDVNHILGTTEEVYEVDYHEIQKDDFYKDFRTQNSDSFLLNKEAFELTKKGAIMQQLENVLSYYTSNHNMIARQNGITYTFSFPSGTGSEWAEYLDDVNLLVVFQGYPYGADRDYTYNKISSAGANIVKKTVYYVEKKSWYYLAHKAGCPKLATSETVLDETFDSIEDCAKIGAYCDECINQGARVPIIN